MRLSSYRAKTVDYIEIRTQIVDYLTEAGPKKTDAVVAEFRGKHGAESVIRALKYLAGDKLIARETSRAPWVLTSAKRSSAGPTAL